MEGLVRNKYKDMPGMLRPLNDTLWLGKKRRVGQREQNQWRIIDVDFRVRKK